MQVFPQAEGLRQDTRNQQFFTVSQPGVTQLKASGALEIGSGFTPFTEVGNFTWEPKKLSPNICKAGQNFAESQCQEDKDQSLRSLQRRHPSEHTRLSVENPERLSPRDCLTATSVITAPQNYQQVIKVMGERLGGLFLFLCVYFENRVLIYSQSTSPQITC